MIMMVVQPHPAVGRVTRGHRVPGDAGLLPADVPPCFRGYYHLLTCSIPNGGGSHSDRTWETDGKRRGKDRSRKTLWLFASLLYHWWSSSSTVSRWKTPRMTVPKTGRAMPSLALPRAMRTTPYPSGTLVFSSLFGASPRRVPNQPEGIAL